MFGGLGIWELLLIFFIVLLFFGARRLPEIGGSLGKGIREFKDSLEGVGDEMKREISPGETPEDPSSRREEGRRGGPEEPYPPEPGERRG